MVFFFFFAGLETTFETDCYRDFEEGELWEKFTGIENVEKENSTCVYGRWIKM